MNLLRNFKDLRNLITDQDILIESLKEKVDKYENKKSGKPLVDDSSLCFSGMTNIVWKPLTILNFIESDVDQLISEFVKLSKRNFNIEECDY